MSADHGEIDAGGRTKKFGFAQERCAQLRQRIRITRREDGLVDGKDKTAPLPLQTHIGGSNPRELILRVQRTAKETAPPRPVGANRAGLSAR